MATMVSPLMLLILLFAPSQARDRSSTPWVPSA